MMSHNDQQETMLEKLLAETKKQTAYTRMLGVSAVGVLIIVVVCFVMLMPGVFGALQKANTLMTELEITIDSIDSAVDDLAVMSKSLTAAGDNMNAFIINNSQTVSEAMAKIEAIDFAGLNKAIKDLGDTVEPFANFFNKFK